jgi:hypothetical protein
MAEENKFEQILSRARELRREAEELRKTSEKLMEQCEMLRRFKQEQKGAGAPAAFDDRATKRSTEPLLPCCR